MTNSKGSRPYTGSKDGVADGATAGLLALVDEINKRSDGALWNNGTYVNRPMRGKQTLSVHATGRAVDISWRKMSAKVGKTNGREYALKMMDFLVLHAEALGLEMCIDYYPKPWGRAYRCDRNAWQNYDKSTVSGAPMGDWFHAEVSPEMSTQPQKIRAVFAKHWNPDATAPDEVLVADTPPAPPKPVTDKPALTPQQQAKRQAKRQAKGKA
jgi:hypothetical protein